MIETDETGDANHSGRRYPVPARPAMLTPRELAKQLNVTVQDLSRLRREGKGPAYVRITKRTVRYLSAEVAEWIEVDPDGQRPTPAERS